jgi:hypothetical protein
MAILPTWAEYIPNSRQARTLVSVARTRAMADAKRLTGLNTVPAVRGLEFAANEAIRVTVLVDPTRSAQICKPYCAMVERLVGAIQPTMGPGAVGGMLSFLNVVVSHGGSVGGSDARGRQNANDREVRWLEGLARRSHKARLLGYAALGLCRPDLAREFSTDPGLCTLVDAFEARARAPFVEMVTRFPESDLRYSEMLFAVRALIVHIEQLGLMGVGATAPWLHQVVRGESGEPTILRHLANLTRL